MCLFAEVAGIDQKQNALGTAGLEQAIHRGNSGEGFTRTRSHMHQDTQLISRQRLLQPDDGADLALTQIAFRQLEPGAEVDLLPVLDNPASLFELLINQLASFGFGHHGHGRIPFLLCRTIVQARQLPGKMGVFGASLNINISGA